MGALRVIDIFVNAFTIVEVVASDLDVFSGVFSLFVFVFAFVTYSFEASLLTLSLCSDVIHPCVT